MITRSALTEANLQAIDADWQRHLKLLLAQFSHLGIGDDLGGLSIIELWGLYGFLVRLE